MRLHALALLAFSCAATVAHAQPIPEAPAEPLTTAETSAWSLGARLHIAPFESYPHVGLGGEALYRLDPRVQLGARLAVYAPETSGNVHRQVDALTFVLRVTIVDTPVLDWYVDSELGLGLLIDDYLRVYEDVTRVAPGLVFGTGVTLDLMPGWRPFLGVRALGFFTTDVSDTMWLELAAGAQFDLP